LKDLPLGFNQSEENYDVANQIKKGSIVEGNKFNIRSRKEATFYVEVGVEGGLGCFEGKWKRGLDRGRRSNFCNAQEKSLYKVFIGKQYSSLGDLRVNNAPIGGAS
jgi:hypothetical protein